MACGAVWGALEESQGSSTKKVMLKLNLDGRNLEEH